MKSICFFASYHTGAELPYYSKVYLCELKKQYKEVIFLTSKKENTESDLEFIERENIRIYREENEGFDFGLWYKAFQKIDITFYDQLVLVNDSCILFKPLDEFVKWSSSDKADIQGMTLSSAVAPHLQSYFLIIHKQAFQVMLDYFKRQGVLKNISEVIKTYEVGLSSYFLSKGFTISAFIDNNEYTGEFSPYYQCADYHLSKGMPLIKKKILYASYRKDELFTLARMNFNISVKHYINLIKRTNTSLILDFEKLQYETGSGMSMMNKLKYHSTRILIRLYRTIFKAKR